MKVRNAVRCYLIQDGRVVVTKYRGNNLKTGYYEIPGGKIEEMNIQEIQLLENLKKKQECI